MKPNPPPSLHQVSQIIENNNETGGDVKPCHSMVPHTPETISQLSHCDNSSNRVHECHANLPRKPATHRAKRYPNCLWRRGTVWQFRKRVPNDVVNVFKRVEIYQSLKTSDYRLAVMLSVL